MKKLKILILSVSILALLIPIRIYADEEPVQQTESMTYGYGNPSELSDYFWDNYILLPYIESTGNQYINTGVNASDDIDIDYYFSNLALTTGFQYIYGSVDSNGENKYSVAFYVVSDSDRIALYYGSGYNSYLYNVDFYNIYNINVTDGSLSVNGSLLGTRTDTISGSPIYLFAYNNNGTAYNFARCRLYYCSMYDNSADSGNGAMVRSYYPARSKSGSVVGLYDAVNDVFYPSSGSQPFSLPDGSDVELSLSAKILAFLTSSLSWSGSILAFAAANPMILFFMAIGLAGAAFRWARRLVHF